MIDKRIRDYGITIGKLKTGERNLITDVTGVKVGHYTLKSGNINTGVTAIIPHEGNLFKNKLVAASHVINGFGKTTGTIQINELGTIETPILLTNTLNVGKVSDALVEYMLEKNEDIGMTTGTVNPIICECNDGYLNDIRGRHIEQEHVLKSLEGAKEIFEEGAVGAGTGMTCYGLKGGIGSASRIVNLNDRDYAVGVLVLSNFGAKEDLVIDGIKIGKRICEEMSDYESDKGSIIVIIATDIPMSERQLLRVCKRVPVGIIRTGSYIGNGSGEIAIAFSTANKIPHYGTEDIVEIKILNEDRMDLVFRAVAEATEEAILNSMIGAETTTGRDNHKRVSLKEYMEELILK
jgi:D-aminopeptidase